ncbi:MAG: hypothetical protein KC495_07265 [Dehalococcoidia bacterium]|nr:hypothetical protein [Dehalococcoidia bacterium]
MAVPIVYLDQNHWIALARASLGRSTDTACLDALAIIEATARRGLAVFPLSGAHYIETHRQHDPERRARLATFMLRISRGWTISDENAVRHEIAVALAEAFPGRIAVPPLNLLGHGVWHAGNQAKPLLEDSLPSLANLPPATRAIVEPWAESLIEWVLLSGVSPDPSYLSPQPELIFPTRFADGLVDFRQRYQQTPAAQRDDLIYARTLMDLQEPIGETVLQNGLSADDVTLEEGRWKGLVDSMPTRRVQVQLHRQWVRNPNLTATHSTLNDWHYLGVAACYADLLVTEKLFADLVSRDGFRVRAEIVTNLRDLPAALAQLTRV